MNLLENPTHYVRGELGTLTTFIVQSLNSMPVSISIQNALAVHIRTNAAQQSLDVVNVSDDALSSST